MISIPRHLIPRRASWEVTGALLPGGGSIISPTTGPSLTRGGQCNHYSQGAGRSTPHVGVEININNHVDISPK